MNREKQIEEMALIIGGSEIFEHEDYLEAKHKAEALYEAGYRKSTDVAEEIFAEIEKIKQDSHCEDCLGEWHEEGIFFGGIEKLKRKYTEGDK